MCFDAMNSSGPAYLSEMLHVYTPSPTIQKQDSRIYIYKTLCQKVCMKTGQWGWKINVAGRLKLDVILEFAQY